MIIKVQNLLTEEAPKSYLSATMEAGTTVITAKNANAFTNGWAVQIGETGEERAEIKVIDSAPSAGTFSVSAGLSYEHPADTPLYAIKYNQVIFKSAAAGTSGTATAITDGTISITPDSLYTQFDDTAGSTSYAYKTSYYSTGLTTESPNSDWFEGTGLPFYSLGKLRERIRSKCPNSTSLTDDQINDWINEWLEEMTNTAINVNEDYALGTANVAFSGTVQEGTITDADFKQVRRAWLTGDGSTWYRMTKMEMTDFNPDETFNETNPFYYMKGDNVIGRQPHDTSGTIGLTFYKLNAVLDSDADTLPVAMRGYTKSYIQHGVAQAKRDDNKETEAQSLEAQAGTALKKFESEISNRNKSGPTYIDIVEGMPNEDIVFW